MRVVGSSQQIPSAEIEMLTVNSWACKGHIHFLVDKGGPLNGGSKQSKCQ
jgi:hypothetical protein